MSDLIKREDALATINTFRRDFEQSWKVQFSADIKALPAVNPVVIHQVDPAAIREAALQARIKELENSLAWYQMMDAMSSDHVVELTDKLEAAEAKLTKVVEALRDILKGDYNWSMAREVLAELEKTE